MNILIEKNLKVRMRDGVELATDVYRPDTREPVPVLVQRLPYNKELTALVNFACDVSRAVQAGYAVVVQDTRGRFASGGEFHPFFDEATDGADTIAWAASQPWSTGKVGMVGGSYFGATQWLAATQSPPALQAIAPYVTAADYHEGWAYQGGAFELGFNLSWTLPFLALGELLRRMETGRATAEDLSALIQAIDRNNELYWRLPLTDMPPLAGLAPYYFEWLAHPNYDDYWRSIAPREYYERITVPALNIGGWYDLFLGGTLANYRGMKERGGSTLARQQQRLIVGPWAHGVSGGAFAERLYGFMASTDIFDLTGVQLRWFDHWLKGIDNGVERDRPVRLFVMGANIWREEDDWPLPDTNFTAYYLHSGGHANSLSGDGLLSTARPGDEPEDVYLYDPRNPVPTVGGQTFLPGLFVGANAGPRDQRVVETRHDVLCYTTEPLERPVEVTGPVQLILYASSSALDTDFTGKLVDVAPDGRAEILTEGILRARYRDSLSNPAPLQPGRIYELRLDLWATANVFAAGHRIRLDVSSSNFPRFDRNTNTGGTIATEGADALVQAVNRVYHDRAHPSHVLLPIVERS
jgi:putative CocE/NonD family hydrolase